jgi:hypothetical protein
VFTLRRADRIKDFSMKVLCQPLGLSETGATQNIPVKAPRVQRPRFYRYCVSCFIR